ncbi:RING finger protein 122 [Anabarilius grahami]|uniref:RING finger protein 122 n=1 Tax=Anabarilius grahami TaxID=495550 RepID=A0A3N0Z7V6_ANAGA|nr:RING finger protein 122 [Anabarilius grahami]
MDQTRCPAFGVYASCHKLFLGRLVGPYAYVYGSCPCRQNQRQMLTCAVCLEDFRTKDELGVLPCQHSFHKRCLVKWLEVRCSCPMCNDNPISAALGQTHSPGNLLDELL